MPRARIWGSQARACGGEPWKIVELGCDLSRTALQESDSDSSVGVDGSEDVGTSYKTKSLS